MTDLCRTCGCHMAMCDCYTTSAAPVAAPRRGLWRPLAGPVAALAGHPVAAPYTPCGGCGATEPSQRCVGCFHIFSARLRPVEVAKPPIPMILHCPKCHVQHVDAPDEQVTGLEWNNPPHRSHQCHNCGCVWRPADVPTTGVLAVTTVGKADNWPMNTETTTPTVRCMNCGCSVEVEAARPLSKDTIRSIFLANGFTIKEGQTDLKPYVYEAARELLRAADTLRKDQAVPN